MLLPDICKSPSELVQTCESDKYGRHAGRQSSRQLFWQDVREGRFISGDAKVTRDIIFTGTANFIYKLWHQPNWPIQIKLFRSILYK